MFMEKKTLSMEDKIDPTAFNHRQMIVRGETYLLDRQMIVRGELTYIQDKQMIVREELTNHKIDKGQLEES